MLRVGVALGKLEGDFSVQVVLLVFRFPVADILPNRIFKRAVGPDGRAEVRLVIQLRDQCEVFTRGVTVPSNS